MLRLNKSVKQISGKTSVILPRRQREQMGVAAAQNHNHPNSPNMRAAAATGSTPAAMEQRTQEQDFQDLCAAYAEEEQGSNWILHSWMLDYDEEPQFFAKRTTATTTRMVSEVEEMEEEEEDCEQAAKPTQSAVYSPFSNDTTNPSSSSSSNSNNSAQYKGAWNYPLGD